MDKNNKVDPSYCCRVCGLKYSEKPWGVDGKSPGHEICDCCGVEFGYEDWTVDSTKSFRKNWTNSGTKWFSNSDKPPNWSLEDQMKNIPEEFK